MNRILRALPLAILLGLGPSIAHAEYLLESPPLQSREAAEAALGRVQAGLQVTGVAGSGVRVVRRYVRGTGWRYFVAVEAIPDDAALASSVAAMGAVQGAPSAYRVQGLDRQPVALPAAGDAPPPRITVPSPPPVTPAPPPAAEKTQDAAPQAPPRAERSAAVERRARIRSALAVLEAAAAAHGGAEGGLAVLDGLDAFAWTFSRTVETSSGRIVAAHRYERAGDAMRLEVRILEGEGTSSVSAVSADGRGWIRKEGGEVRSRSPERIREVLLRFDPRSVLEGVIDLPRDIERSVAWRDLERAGPGNTPEVLLQPSLPPGESLPAAGLVEAAFDATSGRLVRLVWRQSGVERTYRYGDHFEPLPGLVLPRQVEILQGGRRVERVSIDTFDARTRPGSGRFDPPGT